ncbi:MAG: hypothetical protein HY810_07840 [Candidatus Omnitrophica bacterium]|nr:hypothetical protein [Candidatus Omnitrophota bacterium]
MGIESGNADIRKNIFHRTMSNDQIITAAKLIKANGIGLETLNICAIPGATLEQELETLHLNIQCKPDFSLCSLLGPYPGTFIREIIINGNHPVFYCSYSADAGKFTYGSKQKLYEMANFCMLFPLVVKFPRLLPWTLSLMRWPGGWKLYGFCSVMLEWVTYHFIIFPPGRKGFWYEVKIYFEIISHILFSDKMGIWNYDYYNSKDACVIK